MPFYQSSSVVLALLMCSANAAASNKHPEDAFPAGKMHGEEQTFVRILETRGGAELSIADGTSTTLHISTGEPGRVVVEGTVTGFPPLWGRSRVRRQVEALAANPPIEHDGNSVRVAALPWRVRRDLSFSYRFVVPPNTNVYAHGPMAIRVQGLVGNVTLERAQIVRVEDMTGNLHVTGGRVVASEIGGDVVIERAEHVAIDAVGGNVTVTDRVKTIGLDDVLLDWTPPSLE